MSSSKFTRGHSVYNVNGTLENQAENAALNNYREYWF